MGFHAGQESSGQEFRLEYPMPTNKHVQQAALVKGYMLVETHKLDLSPRLYSRLSLGRTSSMWFQQNRDKLVRTSSMS